MKLFAILLAVVFAATGAQAKAPTLKDKVLNMSQCVGLRDLDGLVLSFYDDGTASVVGLTEEATQIIGVNANMYGYSTAYTTLQTLISEGQGDGPSPFAVDKASVETTWKVKGQQVLVSLDGKSAPVSLILGLKSKYCYSAY